MAQLSVLARLIPVAVFAAVAASAQSEARSEDSPPIPLEDRASGTRSATQSQYHNEKYGYTVDLPEGWRVATEFMAEFPTNRAHYVEAIDEVVFTSLMQSEEADVVTTLKALPPGQTSPAPEFFFRPTIRISLTTIDQDTALTTIQQGGLRHIISEVETYAVADTTAAIRYHRHVSNDWGEFLDDVVFIPAVVSGCPDCTGYVMTVTLAGRSTQPPSGDLPPAAYPVEAFDRIVGSFTAPGIISAPAELPKTGGRP